MATGGGLLRREQPAEAGFTIVEAVVAAGILVIAILLTVAPLVVSMRALDRSAIALSLFLRDARGEPVVPDESRLPQLFPDVTEPLESQLQLDIDHVRRLVTRVDPGGLLVDRGRVEALGEGRHDVRLGRHPSGARRRHQAQQLQIAVGHHRLPTAGDDGHRSGEEPRSAGEEHAPHPPWGAGYWS